VVIRPETDSETNNRNTNITNTNTNTNITNEETKSFLQQKSKEETMIKYFVLKKVSGEVESSQILCVVGPEKRVLSAFLRVLTGKIQQNEIVQGHITLDEEEIPLGTPVNCLYLSEVNFILIKDQN
jgi:ABC-type multidrug transport system ATPase subunit